MSKLILVPLESVPSRYTHYWATHLPKMLAEHVTSNLEVIDVEDEVKEATTGAFLNFGFTNVFKSKQAQKIAEMFVDGRVEDGDVFLFTDAWNPTIINVRYMIDLLKINAKIASIWHAGSYDPADFLGRYVKNKNWSYSVERAFYEACNMNFFATRYHLEMFSLCIGVSNYLNARISGFPMEYIKDVCHSKPNKTLITFPHRLSEEKNYNLFLQLKERLPCYEFVACQEKKLTKDEYYDILSRTKILFSANEQETLGIGVFEGMASGAMPLVPNRLSYTEMYPQECLYDPSLIQHPDKMAALIVDIMEGPGIPISSATDQIYQKFFTGTTMYQTLKSMLGASK